MRIIDRRAAAALHAIPHRLLAPAPGLGASTVVWYALQRGRADARYVNSDTLLWRDAGCVLGVQSVVAAALGVHCCALGATGNPYLARSVGALTDELQGVGGCVLGLPERPPHSR